MRNTVRKLSRGFTLVELLVVIAIIAILAVIVGVVVNPIGVRQQGFDATRLADLNTINQAINVAAQEATTSGDEILCFNTTAPCTESSFPVGANTRKSNGSGWVKVNMSSQKSVSMPTLPVDPVNDASHKYTYYSDGDSWEINAVLESDKHKDKMANDGGNANDVSAGTAKYEVGSNLELL